ncbi:MAG: hypothetical protein JNM56_38700 [Planctomycetia bacterium]|nr:hypothetical protein [Planctomycetia bacterium]
MAVTIKHIALYRDVWGKGKLKKNTDIIGLDVQNVNIEVEVEGTEFPETIEVELRTREPGNRFSKRGTVRTPLKYRLQRTGKSAWYLKQVPLREVASFWQTETGVLEVASVVRFGGTSDVHFRGPLINKGWNVRGVGKQPGSPGGETGNDALEQPDALKLLFAGGVEVLEVSVVQQPGWKIKKGTDWGYVRSPADIFYYSGHGAIWNGKIILHPNHDDWCTPEDILHNWKMKGNTNSPADLDVLILNGCSLLNWEAKTGHNPMAEHQKDIPESRNLALRWQQLMCNRKGPLNVLLGNYDSAPLDHNPDNPNGFSGNKIAAQFGHLVATELKHDWDKYAEAWLKVNRPTRAAAAIDRKGYWFTAKDGTTKGPFPLP